VVSSTETDTHTGAATDTDTAAAFDYRLAHALLVDGRAPLHRLARVLGVSDQTVARRYTRLRSADLLRVVGQTDPVRLGEVEWFLRVQCTPDAAGALGAALARRPETAWVNLTSGGTEIVCHARYPAGDGRDGDAPLFHQLPRTPQVVGITAARVLHTFFGGRDSPLAKRGALSAEEIARLTPTPAPATPEPGIITLDAGDERLVHTLAADGRASLATLAEATGWSQTTVRRRLAYLRDTGAVYLDLVAAESFFGLGTSSLLWLTVAPSGLAAVGTALAEHPEIAYVAAVTGAANLIAVVLCRDSAALYDYLTTRVAELSAVRQVETAPVIRKLKTVAR
jgi:DNA-binding Lrp family transcriptional regulator